MNNVAPGNIRRMTLRSRRLRADILTLGAAVMRLDVPDRHGATANVVLAHGDLNDYRTNTPYFGVVVGRYANRIAGGRCQVGDETLELARNNGGNTLHGGVKGFSHHVWSVIDAPTPQRLLLRHISPDGDEGYPGTMVADVTYTLTDDALRVDYRAESDRATIVNLTNHSYFNLAGTGDILRHELTLHADSFLPVTSALIPTGVYQPVEGTPFDFRTPTPIGLRINQADTQLVNGRGYDHCWVLRGPAPALREAVVLRDPQSGRVLKVHTTEPGVQVYTGNFLNGTAVGPEGQRFHRRAGVALETQHFPDSPHHPHFPSVALTPGMTYTSTTLWQFPE